jgi:hypothetical protein
MLDVIAADQDQSAPRVDGSVINYRQTRLSSAHRALHPCVAQPAYRPSGYADQNQHNEERQEEAYGQWHLRAEQIEHVLNSRAIAAPLLNCKRLSDAG